MNYMKKIQDYKKETGAISKKCAKNKRYYYKYREKILKKQAIYQKERRKDVALTKKELLKMNRDELGRFIITNGNQKYKRKQRDGRNANEHVLVWEDYHHKRLPQGHCVHHINGIKKDNRIENLKAMSIPDHTRMHFTEFYKNRDVWNKGKKCPNISESLKGHNVPLKQRFKQRFKLLGKNINRNIKIWELRDNGLTPTQISKKLNLTTDMVNGGWRSLSKVFDINSGRLK